MSPDKNTEEIKELIEHWCLAVRNEDIDGILTHHAKDMVMFDVPPPFQSKGIEAYKKNMGVIFFSSKKPIVFHFTGLKVTASDSIAVCHGIGHCISINPKGEEENIAFRLTMGLSKEDDKWIIQHEHHSVPNEE